jgi:hypothetical protein
MKKAATTPKAAASVGVAMPKYMVPSTAKMMVSMGRIASRPENRSAQLPAASRAAIRGLMRAMM